jgi:hypothetical protein
MNASQPPSRDFTVFQFSLRMGGEGRPVQHNTTCGSFASVEAALAVARKLAELEAKRLDEMLAGVAEVKPVELVDTEWGYDLRRGRRTAARFWVHDASADCPLATD